MIAPVITSCPVSLDCNKDGLNLAKTMLADSASTATDIAASCPIEVKSSNWAEGSSFVPAKLYCNLTSKCIISSAIGSYNS